MRSRTRANRGGAPCGEMACTGQSSAREGGAYRSSCQRPSGVSSLASTRHRQVPHSIALAVWSLVFLFTGAGPPDTHSSLRDLLCQVALMAVASRKPLVGASSSCPCRASASLCTRVERPTCDRQHVAMMPDPYRHHHAALPRHPASPSRRAARTDRFAHPCRVRMRRAAMLSIARAPGVRATTCLRAIAPIWRSVRRRPLCGMVAPQPRHSGRQQRLSSGAGCRGIGPCPWGPDAPSTGARRRQRQLVASRCQRAMCQGGREVALDLSIDRASGVPHFPGRQASRFWVSGRWVAHTWFSCAWGIAQLVRPMRCMGGGMGIAEDLGEKSRARPQDPFAQKRNAQGVPWQTSRGELLCMFPELFVCVHV